MAESDGSGDAGKSVPSSGSAGIDPIVCIASGEREVGGYSFHVYNLADDTRVLSERGFLAVIGSRHKGAAGSRWLKECLSDPVIKHFFSKSVHQSIENPITFVGTDGQQKRGYNASILKDFCVGFVKAKDSGALRTELQKSYASYCQVLLIAFADIGIQAWVDEATGFQYVRERDALNKILDAYIRQDWAGWAKTFPDEFYMQIYRLKGLPFDPDNVRRPGFIGHVTKDIVYSRLAPGVLSELEKRNPVLDESGRRARKHHQWLTEDVGHPKLTEHISNVIFLMKGYGTWDGFYRRLKHIAPRLNEMPEFDFGDDL